MVRLAAARGAPRAVEVATERGFRQAVARLRAVVRATLYPHLDKFALAGSKRLDATDSDGFSTSAESAVVSTLRRRGLAALSPKAVRRVSSDAARSLESSTAREVSKLGIPLRAAGLGPLMDEWREANVARLQGLVRRELDTLVDVLQESEGRTPAQLRDRIEERLGVTERKATYIARDQVGTLNGQITRARHKAAGIESYVWTTAGDERVRDLHRELDGKRFRYDDPPVINDAGDTGHPGDDHTCRCFQYPWLPEIEDEEAAA